MTQTIRARVSEHTIDKVTRLFNGTLADILTELLQNARRANATSVDVNWTRAPGEPDGSNLIRITVSDDGDGIANPQSILSLGESSWSSDVTGEDPAGMGFFSLAGRDVIVTSRAKGGQAWSAHITPGDWTGARAIAVTKALTPRGTTIHFLHDLAGSDHVHRALGGAARYFPLPVTLNGAFIDRADWTAAAIHTAHWRGSTIAVVANRPEYHSETINFFGLTVKTPLPDIHDTRRTRYSVVVDIAANSGLALVLPARKEIVQNHAYEELKAVACRAIYEAIAAMPAHHLAHEQWLEANALEIQLPEASPQLTSWTPETGDSGNRESGKQISASDAIVVPELEPLEGQCLARALSLNTGDDDDTLRLVSEEPRYRGYTWYDALAVLDPPRFEIATSDGPLTITGGLLAPDSQKSCEARSILLNLTTSNTDRPKQIVLATDLAATNDVDSSWLDNLFVFWTKANTINPIDVAQLLEAALFSYNDDGDADSYDTQLAEFQRDAIETAIDLMGTRANLLAHRILGAISDIRWSLANEETITITMSKAAIDVSVTP